MYSCIALTILKKISLFSCFLGAVKEYGKQLFRTSDSLGAKYHIEVNKPLINLVFLLLRVMNDNSEKSSY